MKILCVFGKHNYGDPGRGEGYEFTNFLPALRRLEHEIIFFESFSRAGYRSFSELNRAFLNAVDRNQPDVILCVLIHYELWLETLAIVREKTNCILINWATDDSWKYSQFSRFIAPSFHLYATTFAEAISKARRDGINNLFPTQWAANAATLCPPLPAASCRLPVSFVGSAYGSRPRLIGKLKQHGIDVACFGHGWPGGAVAADVIPKIIRESVISLNFSDSPLVINGWVPSRSRQIKARVFEVPGAGGFLLTENVAGLDNYYVPGAEIAAFDDAEDLVHKIRFYLEHPEMRDRVAIAGHNKTKTDHTYDMRFAEMLRAAANLSGNRSATPRWRFDAGDFDAIAARHRCGWLLSCIRLMLTAVCAVIWGPRRGKRAARRIVFELSWRLAGKRTYTAAGWPGRMFFKES